MLKTNEDVQGMLKHWEGVFLDTCSRHDKEGAAAACDMATTSPRRINMVQQASPKSDAQTKAHGHFKQN